MLRQGKLAQPGAAPDAGRILAVRFNTITGRPAPVSLGRWAAEGIPMGGDAKMTMLLCSGLEADEQAKVERLDGPIAGLFMQARLCQGRVTDGVRVLEFIGLNDGVFGRVPAADFMAAADQAAVAAIALTGR